MAYTSSEAYDFSLFEPQIIETEVQPQKTPKRDAAPKKSNPQRKKQTQHKSQMMTAVSNAAEKVSLNEERKIEEAVINIKYVKAACFGLVCAVLLVISLSLTASNYSVEKQIASVNNEIKIAQSEQVRLSAERSSLIATDRIENLAENVLGMSKAEGQQIDYITRNSGDQITFSGSRTLDEGSQLVGKIKELIAYIL